LPLEAVVGLRDRGRGEGVGLDDVGAGLEVRAMDRADHVGPRQDEQVAVAALRAGMVLEARAAEVRLLERVALDHRPHRPVEDEDPLLQLFAEQGPAFGCGHCHQEKESARNLKSRLPGRLFSECFTWPQYASQIATDLRLLWHPI